MKKSRCSVGVLGRGRFGSMVVEYLSRDLPLRWHDPNLPGGSALEECLAAEVILLCVPMRSMPRVCRQISPLLRQGQLVVDTCSVKIRPVSWMLETLPESVDILGAHPLFGPDSGRNGIRGLKIALCPVRGDRTEPIRAYLESLGLQVIETTPEQHDREMAETQAVFHLISRAIQNAGLNRRQISTPGPEQFFELLYSLQNDSMELFLDLESLNPYATAVRRRLIQALIDLDERISALSDTGQPKG
ncbi:MAG: prephenate dehydrogenase/arogenate dehydrogenase family protein [Acidobacteria bacterium]|nr:prephenate dehydrogenase/arogenate dehydrogenase family protein [Acidobacteriota bacterium]